VTNSTSLRGRKRRHGATPIVMITAYDEPTARYADAAGVDVLLVGDSLANVVLGHEDTLHVSVEQMVEHVRAVAAAKPRAHIVADMPWLSYHVGSDAAVANAGELIRAGAQSVKLEGGVIRREVVRALIHAEIPVMGHLGLTPQSVLALGGYKVQAKTRDAAKLLLEDALVLQSEGVYAIVIEAVPRLVGTQLTQALDVPTIGIGAGPDTDGQVLVLHDLVGLTKREPPKFVRRYAQLGELMTEAVAHYARDVRDGSFPDDSESYDNPEELRD
jgi:3-methyl-2-oxobutanoate hydroxymethyltransferase